MHGCWLWIRLRFEHLHQSFMASFFTPHITDRIWPKWFPVNYTQLCFVLIPGWGGWHYKGTIEACSTDRGGVRHAHGWQSVAVYLMIIWKVIISFVFLLLNVLLNPAVRWSDGCKSIKLSDDCENYISHIDGTEYTLDMYWEFFNNNNNKKNNNNRRRRIHLMGLYN